MARLLPGRSALRGTVLTTVLVFTVLATPAGTIPFHYWADTNGRFYWGTIGVPAGLTVQSVAIEIRPGQGYLASNVVQIGF